MSPAFPPSIQFCLQTTPWPHCLSFDSNSHLFVGSFNIHKDAGLLVPSPPHFQWSCPLSDFSHLLPGSDFFMTKNNYNISEIVFLSFLPSDHHFLSFQPPSLGPSTQVIPLFQEDLQPILTALSMNTLHPFSLRTHHRFHHHNHCLSFHSILHSLENSNPG